MAIIYSYPLSNNILATDVIVGTTTTLAGGRPRNQTKSFEIGDLATYFASIIAPPGTYVPYNGATGPVNLGAYDLTLNGATIGRGGGQIYSNIVFGLSSLLNNTTGQNNTYLGFSSGYYNTIGSYNTAIGAFASQFTTTGNYNTTIGNTALYTNTTGSYNLAIGTGALFSNTTGSNNIAIGYATQTQSPGDNNSIVIGSSATGIGSNTVVLGNSSVTTTRLRGNVQGGAFVKDGGTNVQYLMADGSVTTGPIVTGFVPYTGATGAVDLGAYNLTVNSISVGKGAGTGANNIVVGNQALASNTTGNTNVALGSLALQLNTIGVFNHAVGAYSLNKNTTGNSNIAIGYNALTLNTTASNNIAIGIETISASVTTSNTIAIGHQALRANTTGTSNTAVGHQSMFSNVGGYENTALGYQSLTANNYGLLNTAIGFFALKSNTTGNENVALGWKALSLNTVANSNTAIGTAAMQNNTTGYSNTAVGSGVLANMTTGVVNTAIGNQSLQNLTTGQYNSAIGFQSGSAITTGLRNTALGPSALYYSTTGNDNIAIGNGAGSAVILGSPVNIINRSIFIGNTSRPELNNQTNQIVIGDSAIGIGSNTVTIGDTNITTTRLRGAVQGGSFVKDGGTVIQYLMADGSITTSGPLFKAVNSVGGTGVVSVISSAILGSLFPDGSILKIQTMVTFGPSQTLNITPVTYYINTSPSLVGATQIATYDISVGQRYAWMDRSFWSIGGTFNARNFLNSSQTSVSNSGSTLGSTSIPATFYIIATINVGAGDLGTIASILIEKQ